MSYLTSFQPENFTEDMLQLAFSISLQGMCSRMLPLVTSQGTMVKSFIKQGQLNHCLRSKSVPICLRYDGSCSYCFVLDLEGEFLMTLTCNAPPSNHALSSRTSYCLLHPDVLEGVKVQVADQLTPGSRPKEVPILPFWTTQQFDLPLPKVSLKQLG